MNRQQRRALKSKEASAQNLPFLISTLQRAAKRCKEGRLVEAFAEYKKVLEAAPDEPLAHCNIGGLYVDLGRYEEAVAACNQAIALDPNLALAYFNLGRALQQLSLYADAASAYRKAMDLDPTYLEPTCIGILGALLYELGHYTSAIEIFQLALRIDPDCVEVLVAAGIVYQKTGQYQEAISSLERARALVPQRAEVLFQLCKAYREICNWRDLDGHDRILLDLLHQEPVPQGLAPFVVLGMPSSPAEQLNCAKAWVPRYYVPEHLRFTHSPDHTKSRDRDRVRIGYFSSDFFDHATAHLITELIEVHDRSKYEVIAYSHSPDDGSVTRERLEAAFDKFVDVTSVSDFEAARIIHNDRVDILIDLKGYTHNIRPRVLAHRPAPIQVSYLGFPGTTGAHYIDYVIGDAIVTPMTDEPYYTEKIVQLPNCYQPNDAKRHISDWRPTREECGLPQEGVVFCCFNNSYKLNSRLFDIWMRLLAASPNSVLWLMDTGDMAKTNLRREAIARGINPERLVFAPKLRLPEHLARHRLADIFLDTLPYNAHTTASDALWAGLPVITCMGGTFAGRVAASLLKAIGLPNLITASLEEYESLALKLAGDPGLIADAKTTLRKNRDSTPLFNTIGYTRDLEAAFDRMLERYLSGLRPESFSLTQES